MALRAVSVSGTISSGTTSSGAIELSTPVPQYKAVPFVTCNNGVATNPRQHNVRPVFGGLSGGNWTTITFHIDGGGAGSDVYVEGYVLYGDELTVQELDFTLALNGGDVYATNSIPTAVDLSTTFPVLYSSFGSTASGRSWVRGYIDSTTNLWLERGDDGGNDVYVRAYIVTLSGSTVQHQSLTIATGVNSGLYADATFSAVTLANTFFVYSATPNGSSTVGGRHFVEGRLTSTTNFRLQRGVDGGAGQDTYANVYLVSHPQLVVEQTDSVSAVSATSTSDALAGTFADDGTRWIVPGNQFGNARTTSTTSSTQDDGLNVHAFTTTQQITMTRTVSSGTMTVTSQAVRWAPDGPTAGSIYRQAVTDVKTQSPNRNDDVTTVLVVNSVDLTAGVTHALYGHPSNLGEEVPADWEEFATLLDASPEADDVISWAGRTPNTPYYFAIVSVDASNNKTLSNILTITTAPARPTNAAIAQVGNDFMTATWIDASGGLAAHEYLYREDAAPANPWLLAAQSAAGVSPQVTVEVDPGTWEIGAFAWVLVGNEYRASGIVSITQATNPDAVDYKSIVSAATTQTAAPGRGYSQYGPYAARSKLWIFYPDGTDFVLRTKQRADGGSWSASSVVVSGKGGDAEVSVAFDGTYFHFAYTSGNDMVYRRAFAEADGTLTFDAAQTAYSNASWTIPATNQHGIAVDQYGHVWIVFQGLNTPTSYYYSFLLSSIDTSGGWTARAGFPVLLGTNSLNALNGIGLVIAPMGENIIAGTYEYTYSVSKARKWTRDPVNPVAPGILGNLETTTAALDDGRRSNFVVYDDGTVLWCRGSKVLRRSVAGAWTDVSSGLTTSDWSGITLANDELRHWRIAGTQIEYRSSFDKGTTWTGTQTKWTGLVSGINMTCSQLWNVGEEYHALMWREGAGSPYDIGVGIDGVVPTIHPPTFVSATTNAAGTQVLVTFDEEMADPTGLHASFDLDEGVTPRTFSAAALDANPAVIVLTVSGSPIAHSETLLLSYTPGTVQSADGEALAAFVDQPVTNAVPTPPVVTSSWSSGDGTTITHRHDKAMSDPSGQHGAYSFREDGGAPRSYSAAALGTDTRDVVLTVSGAPVTPGAVLDGSYTPGTVQSTQGVALEAFTNIPIANQTAAALRIINVLVPNAVIGEGYSYTMEAENGTAPYVWSEGAGFPGWLSINPSTGELSGTVAGPETSYVIEVFLTDDDGTSTVQEYTLTVVAAPGVLATDAQDYVSYGAMDVDADLLVTGVQLPIYVPKADYDEPAIFLTIEATPYTGFDGTNVTGFPGPAVITSGKRGEHETNQLFVAVVSDRWDKLSSSTDRYWGYTPILLLGDAVKSIEIMTQSFSPGTDALGNKWYIDPYSGDAVGKHGYMNVGEGTLAWENQIGRRVWPLPWITPEVQVDDWVAPNPPSYMADDGFVTFYLVQGYDRPGGEFLSGGRASDVVDISIMRQTIEPLSSGIIRPPSLLGDSSGATIRGSQLIVGTGLTITRDGNKIKLDVAP